MEWESSRGLLAVRLGYSALLAVGGVMWIAGGRGGAPISSPLAFVLGTILVTVAVVGIAANGEHLAGRSFRPPRCDLLTYCLGFALAFAGVGLALFADLATPARVVDGIAAIALMLFAIWVLLRHSEAGKRSATPGR